MEELELIELNFYFELSEELEMAIDEEGNFGKAYVRCSLIVEKDPTAEQRQKLENAYKKLVAEKINGFIDFVIPITEEEYKQNVKDEE